MMQVLVYTRVSTDRQVEGYSLDAQERLCTEAALRRGDEVVGVVRDAGEHGDDPNRPGLRELRERLADGEADGVYVLDLDRFFRHYTKYLVLAHELVEAGHSLYVVSSNADYGNEDNRFGIHVLAAAAAKDLRDTRRRVKRSLSERVQNGLTLGPAPFGYQKQVDERGNPLADEPIIPEFGQAAFVRELFDRYLNGESLQALGEDMSARGIRSHRGGVRWTAARVGEILRNPVYIGRVIHGDDDFPGQHRGIIDLERWEAVQDRLRSRTILHPRTFGSLSPLMRCGLCKGPVRISKSPDPNRNYFQCAMRFNRPAADRHEPFSARSEAVEAFCWSYIRSIITSGDLRRAAELHRERRSRPDDRRAELAQRLKEVEDEITVTARAASRGLLPEDMALKENRPRIELREKLRWQLDRIDVEADASSAAVTWSSTVGSTLIDWLEQLPDAGHRREWLARVIARVDLWSDRITILPLFEDLQPVTIDLPTYWRTEGSSRDVAID